MHACGSYSLCRTDGVREAGLPSTSPVRETSSVLRAQGQLRAQGPVLQDHASQALPS
jgi:hypothetical protein